MEIDRVINVGLIRNPYNWAAIVLMLLIFLASLAALHPALDSYGAAVHRVL